MTELQITARELMPILHRSKSVLREQVIILLSGIEKQNQEKIRKVTLMSISAKIFSFHRCATAQKSIAYGMRSMRMERQINIYRLIFFVLLMLMDSVGFLLMGGEVEKKLLFDPSYVWMMLSLLGISAFVHYKTKHALKEQKAYRFLPFISVFAEFLILLSFVKMILKGTLPLPISADHMLMIFSFVAVLLNLLGAIRANKGVVVFQTLLLTTLVTRGFFLSPEKHIIGFYIAGFVFLSGIFSLWISDILSESFLANQRLEESNKEIRNASEEIKQQNEEILTQRDEIQQQRDVVLDQNKNITDSIRYAFKIQQAVFPPKSFMENTLPKHFILNLPRDIVSGDFYWVQEHKGLLYIAVADCTGHGVPGAFMSMLGTNMLNGILRQYIAEEKIEELTPATLLNELREKVKEALHQKGKIFEMKDGMDMALVRFDPATNKLDFAGANNPAIIIRPNAEGNEIIHLKGDRMPVAIHRRERPFTDHEIQLQKGDMLYMFSDGFVDQFGGEEGQKLMIKRFKKILDEYSQLPLDEQCQKLEKYLDDWRNRYEQVDDILVMGIKI